MVLVVVSSCFIVYHARWHRTRLAAKKTCGSPSRSVLDQLSYKENLKLIYFNKLVFKVTSLKFRSVYITASRNIFNEPTKVLILIR